jgi:hypothetical protein
VRERVLTRDLLEHRRSASRPRGAKAGRHRRAERVRRRAPRASPSRAAAECGHRRSISSGVHNLESRGPAFARLNFPLREYPRQYFWAPHRAAEVAPRPKHVAD